jgi:hypothetical protein
VAGELDNIRDIVDDRLRQVNVCLPGRIKSYSASTRKAEVEPLVKERYADGTVLTLPVITGVPVVMPATSSSGLILPVGDGDPCLILFAQRSIDRWLTNGGVQESADKRMHAMSDAIAIVGLFPFSDSPETADAADGVKLHNDGEVVVASSGDEVRLESGTSATKATLKTQADAKIALGTSAVEVLDEVTKAFDEIAIGLAAIPSPNTQTLASSAALKTIKGSI